METNDKTVTELLLTLKNGYYLYTAILFEMFEQPTDRQTDTHEREYRGHPFNVSEVCPSTNHQGSVHESLKIA